MTLATDPANRETPQARQRVMAFYHHYGEAALNLAYHAAFPLTLTSDLLYCLREEFFCKKTDSIECPWYTVGDILLSGLCEPVGHDLYEMDPDTRSFLLNRLYRLFGKERLEALQQFMQAYIQHRLTLDPPDRARILGDRPEWTALAFLKPGEAVTQIQQALQAILNTDNTKERLRLASIVEHYADVIDPLAQMGYRPFLLEWADRASAGDSIGDTPLPEPVELAQALGVTLDLIDVTVVTLTDGTAPPPGMQAFQFVTLWVDEAGTVIEREDRQAFAFLEALGEGIAPLEMVAIPSGTFLMGSTKAADPGHYDDESPQHSVTVPPFFMSRYPITQAQWRFVATLPQIEHDLNPNPARFRGDNRPVEQVNWFEAKEFCARLSQHTSRPYDLPSEAEWEYACRATPMPTSDTPGSGVARSAGATTPYHVGPTLTRALANYAQNVGETTPVGQYGHANAFGLSDLHGNVREWCLDYWHETYQGAPIDGSAWIEGGDSSYRVLRGGSWIYSSRFCRSACRSYRTPDYRDNGVGFRVVCRPRRASSG